MLVLREKMDTKSMVKISILSVLAFIIMFFEAPLWFAPPFLEIDLSDLPALIGAFAMGPVAGVVIELLKNILNIGLQGTDTAGIGELANFIVGSLFVFSASSIYFRKKSLKNAIIGMIVGTIVMAVAMSVANYFVLIPFYSKAYGMPIEAIIGMASKVNSIVVDLKTFIIYTVVPFNLIKGVLLSVLALPLYKKLAPILKR
ncbi:ECF transporter S component [Dethiothermospora halolimnae]|uniref:ECF transporter S component n=1 Tax=Dethiothermospora halolimnae TaxID=3114390 RepID=UPI003CCBEE1E